MRVWIADALALGGFVMVLAGVYLAAGLPAALIIGGGILLVLGIANVVMRAA